MGVVVSLQNPLALPLQRDLNGLLSLTEELPVIP